jgi:hypothetical protein
MSSNPEERDKHPLPLYISNSEIYSGIPSSTSTEVSSRSSNNVDLNNRWKYYSDNDKNSLNSAKVDGKTSERASEDESDSQSSGSSYEEPSPSNNVDSYFNHGENRKRIRESHIGRESSQATMSSDKVHYHDLDQQNRSYLDLSYTNHQQHPDVMTHNQLIQTLSSDHHQLHGYRHHPQHILQPNYPFLSSIDGSLTSGNMNHLNNMHNFQQYQQHYNAQMQQHYQAVQNQQHVMQQQQSNQSMQDYFAMQSSLPIPSHIPFGLSQSNMTNYPMSIGMVSKSGNLLPPHHPAYMNPNIPFHQRNEMYQQALGLYRNEAPKNEILPQKRTKRDIPDWVEYTGELVHSDAQLQSGLDLTKIKRKYKILRCKYCAEFNPTDAPWATFKSRKFEDENFVEHEKSTHHLRAVLRRNVALGQPITSQLRGLNSPQDYEGNSNEDTGGVETPPDLDISHRHFSYLSAFGHNGERNEFNFTGYEPKSNLGLNSSEPVKTKVAPVWLKAEGKLCHSEKQVNSAIDLKSVKKKYKRIICVFCEQFNSSSPWAVMRTRKYEAAVLNEHERSHHHRKALSAREVSLGSSLNFDGFGSYEGHLPFNSITMTGLEGNLSGMSSLPIHSMPVYPMNHVPNFHLTSFSHDMNIGESVNHPSQSMYLNSAENSGGPIPSNHSLSQSGPSSSP